MGDMNDKVPALPINISSRRMSKSGAAGLPSPPASMPVHKYTNMEGQELQDSAIDDQENASPEEGDSFQKARGRRASDGQSNAKEGRRFNRPELRCEHCGKGYKHSSCLTKHLFVPLFPPPPTPPVILPLNVHCGPIPGTIPCC